MDPIIQQIATELNKRPDHVENVVRLLDEGNTIPFIARYRKELHGAMDDTSLRTLEERLQYLRGLAERKEAVKSAIEEQGKLTAGALRRHRHRRHPGGGGGPLPALQAEAPHPGHHCPGKGPGPSGGSPDGPGCSGSR